MLLLLVRSALGAGLISILGLILGYRRIGYLAMAGPTFGNLPFLVIMIGLTLSVVVAVSIPIAGPTRRCGWRSSAPAAVGAALLRGARDG